MQKSLFNDETNKLAEYIPNQTYKNFLEASESNWDFAKFYFGNREGFKLIDPVAIFKRKRICIDAIVLKAPNLFLVEIKRRQTTFQKIKDDWNGELFLEKKKYDAMIKMRLKMLKDDPTREIHLHYLNTTSDGYVILWDLTFLKPSFEYRTMNNVTYGEQKQVNKKVALLNIEDAKIQKIKQ